MMQSFINKQALEKGAVRPARLPIICKKSWSSGCGDDGHGIARLAQAGIDVVLIDQSQEAAVKLLKHMDKGIAWQSHERKERGALIPHNCHHRLLGFERRRSHHRSRVRRP